MTGFYGRTYRYKDKVIGVCQTIDPNVYMVGYATPGGHKRMSSIPLSDSVDLEQARLNMFAMAKGLPEVRA